MLQHQLTADSLLTDWRGDARTWLWVDLETWPTALLPEPYPPVPIIAVGAGHPQQMAFDVRVDSYADCEQVARAITKRPRTAATITRLLRASEGLDAGHALTLESMAFAALQGGGEHRDWMSTRPMVAPRPPGVLHVCASETGLDLIMDRPVARNAIDRAMRDALFDAFTAAALDDRIATVRLRGTGRCFCVGADLAEFGTTNDPSLADAIRARTLPAGPLLRLKSKLEVVVQGACIGAGLELAAFADRLIATPDAWFQLPEAVMGILPGFGGCVSVPRRVGRQRAAWLLLSGRRIDARTALAWGLIDAIVDDVAADNGRADEIG